MQQEAAKELVDTQSEELLRVAMCIVAIAEADALAVEGDDAGVADGDAMRVVGQIAEHLLGAAEGRLAVDDPVGGTSPRQEQVEGDRVGDDTLRNRERSLAPGLAQRARQQRAEATRENPDRQEEGGLGRRAPLPVMSREATARYDAVDVRVQRQRLSPGVKHGPSCAPPRPARDPHRTHVRLPPARRR